MPAKQPQKISVACPHCGHTQPEPPSVYSTVCKECHQHFRVQDVLKPAPKPKARPKDLQQVICPHCGNSQDEPKGAYSTVCKKCHQHFRTQEVLPASVAAPERPREVRRVACFQCGTELEVAPAAQSTLCKRCSSFVDLTDYCIDHPVAKNFKTKGRFLVEEKGFVFNTDSIVGEAVIKGRYHGKLVAERLLEIHSSAELKGVFQTARLVIPPGNHFRWHEKIVVASAEIGGELAANLQAKGTVSLQAAARMFGNVEAKGLVIESGAVFVGEAKIRPNTAA